MPDIMHRLSMNAPRDEVYRALNADMLLASFARLGVRLLMVYSTDGERAAWRCTEGPPEWIGTDISFELEHEGEQGETGETVVSFTHKNWSEPSLFMATCATCWARTLFRVKRWVETAEPEDVAC